MHSGENQIILSDVEREQMKDTSLKAQIERDFTYHSPKGDQPERYSALRTQGKELALTMARLCPASKELEQALSLLNLAVMSANAAIARNE